VRERPQEHGTEGYLQVKAFTTKNRIHLIAVASIVILGFVVYANSLGGEFIWDDDFLVRQNQCIRSWNSIPTIFAHGASASFYRPVQTISYMMDYSLWELNPMGYHITNTLVHILAALCIYCLINMLFSNGILSLLTSVLFVIHPIHTEAVTYISGRADSLATLFMLLCFIFYLKRPGNTKTSILMGSAFVLALLSKETALVLPVLLSVHSLAFKEKPYVKKLLSLLGIALIYILMRTTFLKGLLPCTLPYSSTLFQRVPGFFVAITNYLRLIVLPLNLHMCYGSKLFEFSNPKAILGITMFLSSLIYALTRRDKLISFSLLWFFVTLLPVSNIYRINAYMAEHWLYLPSIGLFLILAKLLILCKANIRVFPAALMVVSYSYLTIKQNNYWREPVTFYSRTLKYAPEDPRLYCQLALSYIRDGRNEEAIELYKKAMEVNPRYVISYYNLGNRYCAMGEFEEAIKLYEKAILLDPNYAEAYNNLGNAHKAMGRTDKAMIAYKKTIGIDPDNGSAHYNLAILYYNRGDFALAIEYCDKTERLGHQVHSQFLERLKSHR
jgi:tetratricopeptide (TPR) repeat protein